MPQPQEESAEMSVVEQLFAGLTEEDANPTEGMESESQTESEKPADPTLEGSEGDKTPEDKPDELKKPDGEEDNRAQRRWTKLMSNLQEKERLIEELSQKLNGIEEKTTKLTTEVVDTKEELPPEFVALFGDNPEIWPLFSKTVADLSKKQMTALLQEREEAQRAQSQAEKQALERANQFINEGIEKLGAEIGVDLSEDNNPIRNGVLNVAKKYLPSDDSGNLSFAKAYEIYRLQNPEVDKTQERKKIAALSAPGKATVSDSEEVITQDKLKKLKLIDFFK